MNSSRLAGNIAPQALKIDFAALGQVKAHARGIGVTLFINWAVKRRVTPARTWSTATASARNARKNSRNE